MANRILKICSVSLFIVLTNSCRTGNQLESLDDCNLKAEAFDSRNDFNFSDTFSTTGFFGIWKSQSYWLKDELNWKGYKSLDISHEYEFNENHVFNYKVVKNGNILNCSKQGKYDIEIDSNYLILFTNNNHDTIFNHGDTVDIEKILIHYLNDSILRFGECHFTNFEENEFVEYKKL